MREPLSPFFLIAVLGVLVLSPAARAGSYVNVALCTESAGCLLNTEVCHPQCEPDCDDPDCTYVRPFVTVHPYGYSGGIGVMLTLKVCVEASDMELAPTVERAIALWEAPAPVPNQNCQHCTTHEGALNLDGALWAHPVLLHELGHCALGLDHVERHWDVNWDGLFEPTSFTRSAEAAYLPEALDFGADGIRGSGDDFHQAFGGGPAESVSWFRQADNDPFVVDATIIDTNTYSRSLSNLPVPDTWGASGNLDVALVQGYLQQQAVMYGLYQRRQYFRGLLADDVNMLKMARTGEDWEAGTADDYAVDLDFVGDCSKPHDIKVEYGPTAVGAFGQCENLKIDYSFSGQNPFLARHFSIVRGEEPANPLRIVLNENVVWTLGEPIFEDGFESGDLTEWVVVNDGSGGEEEMTEEAVAALQYEWAQEALIDEEVRLLEELGLLPGSSDEY